MNRHLVHQAAAMVVMLCAAAAFMPAQENAPPFRLSADVAVPTRYAVDLTLVPDQDTFKGAIQISIEFKKAASILWLNSEKLQIKSATLTVGQEVIPAHVVPTPKDYVRLEFKHAVGPGKAVLRASYEGQISRKDNAGIFQVKDSDQWYIYTQFESISARRAFPCFDEPGYKVPWQVTLHVPKGLAAVSNAPSVSESDDTDGMKTVKFAETKPLPSYLVAVAVGNFDFVDAGTTGQKHTRVRIVTPHGRGSEAKYAAETTPAIVDLLEKYFMIPYPYEKLDEVAIPLFGGAMEHPGMVTFGAAIILNKPGSDTPEAKRLWVSISSHELSHQWFGDLVTTAWWDDIWLNEGFASWMANKNVNQFHPEWHMNISELNAHQDAMENDALVSARRVRQPIQSNNDINNAFDGITYNKGSALLNMFESYTGPERFRKGIQDYLKQYSWKNATSSQFLAAVSGGDAKIASAFSSFLDQAGVPLVKVKLDCGAGSAQLKLSQQRLLPLGSGGVGGEQWKIPVCVRYPASSGVQRQCKILDDKTGTMILEAAKSCPQWIEANADANGYYRVAYEGDLLNHLLKENSSALTLPERVSLIGDIQALTGNGVVALSTAMGLVSGLARDPDRTVISKTLRITSGLQDSLVEVSMLPKYRRYLCDVYGPRARQLGQTGKPGDTDDERLLRPRLADVLANQADDPESQAEARRLALAWFDDRNAVTADMIGTVLSAAAIHGDRALFDHMRTAAKSEQDEQIQGSLLFAMGEFRDPEILRVSLPIVLTDEYDTRQSLNILFGAAQSSATRDQAFDLIKQNWDTLIAKLPTDVGAYMPYLASGYCDEQHRQEVQAYFDGRSTKFTGGPRILAQVLESIDLCIAYKKAQQPSLRDFLEHYGDTTAGVAVVPPPLPPY